MEYNMYELCIHAIGISKNEFNHRKQVLNPDPYQGRWGGKNCRDSPIQTTRNCNCSPNECEATQNYYQDLEEVFRYSIPVGRSMS